MKILIAEDDPVSRKLLEITLCKWTYETVVTSDGNEAQSILMSENSPNLAILDWMMPGKDGVEICREVAGSKKGKHLYLILLTAKGNKSDIVQGLDAGADDYVIKPFDKGELRARVKVGERIVNLELSLQNKVVELQKALDNIKQLQGIIPICAWCKKVRDDGQYWRRVEEYITDRSGAEFSHSICPECRETQFGNLLREQQAR